jgi:hypothetical protein
MYVNDYNLNAYNPLCAAGFALLNLPKGKSLGRSKPETNSYAQALATHCGLVSSLFFSRSEITAALSLHFQHLMKTKG